MSKFKEVDERVVEISQNYDIAERFVESYLAALLEYDFIVNGDEEKLYICLERIVADRMSQKVMLEYCSRENKTNVMYRSLKDTFSEMIFRTYGEQAFYDLNEFFLASHSINLDFDEYEEIPEEESEYKGYNR